MTPEEQELYYTDYEAYRRLVMQKNELYKRGEKQYILPRPTPRKPKKDKEK